MNLAAKVSLITESYKIKIAIMHEQNMAKLSAAQDILGRIKEKVKL